jgi:phosphate transport system protein
MARIELDRDLRQMCDELLSLGSMVEKAISDSITGLRTRDTHLAQQVIAEDDIIDRKRFEMEERCINLIAMQQPIASDLRLILATLHIAEELERMGDYAEGIAKISLLMGDEAPLKPLIDIPRMANLAIEMLGNSLSAFTHEDLELARKICQDDDEVDALYDQVYRELLTFMMQDHGAVQRATYLLWVAHNLERIADRATNIAERVTFLVTGDTAGLHVSKY